MSEEMENTPQSGYENEEQHRKNHRILIWVLILFFLLLFFLIFRCCFCEKCRKVAEAEGSAQVMEPREDTTSVSVAAFQAEPSAETEEVYTLDMLTPTGVDVYVGDPIVLKDWVRSKTQEVLAAKHGELPMPTCGMQYSLNSKSLSPAGLQLAKAFAEAFLATNGDAVILVEGYTCDLGRDESNLSLSEERAETLKAALVQHGVPEEKIRVKGYGESRYNRDPKIQGREANRRVTMRIAQ